MNPECNTILNLEIYGPDIINLALLSNFDTIEYLTISHNSTISNLDFLETVEISSGISLQSLDKLVFLSKFEEKQPKNLNIYNCPLLTAIELKEEYYNNISLQNLNLEVTVKHDICIGHLILSQNVSFNSLAEVKVSQLKIHNATEYKSFTSITNDFSLDTLTSLQIWGTQDTFNSEGFPDSMVCRSFEIAGLNNLDVSGFENKTAFFRSFELNSISNLKDLNPFDKMHTEDRVSIQNCDSISSLDGIPISQYVDAIFIRNNSMLTDIQDITKVDDTYRLSLVNNPLLATCNNRLVCDLTGAPNSASRLKISGNNSTCMDVPSVAPSCLEREPVECSATFLGTSLYDYDQVNLSFEFVIPQSAEDGCDEDEKMITIHLDGSERKEIYAGSISSSNTDIQTLNIQVSNIDLLNEGFDCLDIAVQSDCADDNCYFYICQVLNRDAISTASELSIYPNPASENLTISSDVAFVTVIIEINGLSVKYIKLEKGSNSIDLSDLHTGVYFIRDNQNQYRKIVIY